MEAVGVIGLASSIIGVTDVIARSVQSLLGIQAAYKSAHIQITLTLGYLTTVTASLVEIQRWMSNSPTHHAGLYSEIKKAVDCCEIVVLALDERIQAVNRNGTLSVKSRIAFALEEQGIKTFSDHLGNQVNALNLLITVAHCRTNEERTTVLQESETQQAFRQIEDDSSSYVSLSRNQSRRTSVMTSTLANLDAEFEFDSDIMLSHVYRQALRSVLQSSDRPSHIRGLSTHIRSEPLGDIIHEREESNEVVASDTRSVSTMASTIRGVTDEPANASQDDGEELSEVDRHLEGAHQDHSDVALLVSKGAEPVTEKKADENEAARTRDVDIDTSQSAPWGLEIRVTTEIDHKQEPEEEEESQEGPQESIEKEPKPRRLGIISSGKRQKAGSRPQGNNAMDKTREKEAGDRKGEGNVKILVLGTSEGGKTTLLKHMKIFYEGPYSLEEKESLRPLTISNLINSVQTLLKAMASVSWNLEDDNSRSAAELVLDTDPADFQSDVNPTTDAHLPSDVVHAILVLQEDAQIQAYADRFGDYQTYDCVKYFWGQIHRITSPGYIPTTRDILYARNSSTGVATHNFEVDEYGSTRTVVEAAGPRSERRKWQRCIETSNDYVICTADIGSYDQRLLENGAVGQLGEDLMVVGALMRRPWFSESHLVLLFTKVDKLRTKLRSVPIRNHIRDLAKSLETAGDVKAYLARRFVCQRESRFRSISVVFSTLVGDEVGPAHVLEELFVNPPAEKIAVFDYTEESGSPDRLKSWTEVLQRTSYM